MPLPIALRLWPLALPPFPCVTYPGTGSARSPQPLPVGTKSSSKGASTCAEYATDVIKPSAATDNNLNAVGNFMRGLLIQCGYVRRYKNLLRGALTTNAICMGRLFAATERRQAAHATKQASCEQKKARCLCTTVRTSSTCWGACPVPRSLSDLRTAHD